MLPPLHGMHQEELDYGWVKFSVYQVLTAPSGDGFNTGKKFHKLGFATKGSSVTLFVLPIWSFLEKVVLNQPKIAL